VVELHPDKPKHYRKSSDLYSSSVAGVISTQAGIYMGGQTTTVRFAVPSIDKSRSLLDCCTREASSLSLTVQLGNLSQRAAVLTHLNVSAVVDLSEQKATQQDSRPLLALVGRVPVKVTSENGPIRVGDLLTSASKRGFAMRCSNLERCEGVVIGKAMANWEHGEGMIMMLVIR
jgi:hypothetical protein